MAQCNTRSRKSKIQRRTWFHCVGCKRNIYQTVPSVCWQAQDPNKCNQHRYDFGTLLGHAYSGRNTAQYSLQINTDVYKNDITVDMDSMTVKVGSSVRWGKLYPAVAQQTGGRYIVIGGSDPSVGVTGWGIGGGHSPISTGYGLGVDSIVSVDLVLANGEFVTASENSNQDLYWALRGGGASSWGVITHITYKLHPQVTPQIVGLSCIFPLWKSTAKLIDNFFATAPLTVSGYIITSNSSDSNNQYIMLSLVARMSWQEGYQTLKPLTEIPIPVYGCNPDGSYDGGWANYSTFWDYEQGTPAEMGGLPLYLTNTLINQEQFSAESGVVQAAVDFPYMSNGWSPLSCTGTLIGGNTTAFANNSETAVGDYFRQARVSMSCGTVWLLPGDNEKLINEMDQFTRDMLTPIGNGGMYFNEEWYNAPDWKERIWGPSSNGVYDRLLKIKKEIDPDNRFTCHHCVGSDEN